jgi:hypothetical protein
LSFHEFPVIGNEHHAQQPLHVGPNDSRDNPAAFAASSLSVSTLSDIAYKATKKTGEFVVPGLGKRALRK